MHPQRLVDWMTTKCVTKSKPLHEEKHMTHRSLLLAEMYVEEREVVREESAREGEVEKDRERE